MMTPSEIDVLLRCATAFIRMDSPSNKLAIVNLIDQGLVILGNEITRTYIPTAKGNAHISQLCNLALPVPAWGDADGKIIKPHNQGGVR